MQILHDIFPIVTYSNLLATALLPFAVSPRILGVKGCSIVAALARIATRILLIYGTSLASIQVSEVLHALVPCLEPMFYLCNDTQQVQALAKRTT